MSESNIPNTNRRLAVASGSSEQSLTTSYTIVKNTSKLADTAGFALVSDGGLRCPASGAVLVDGMVSLSGLNTTDIAQLAVGVYRNGGWVTESISARNVGGSTTSIYLGIIPLAVQENDIVYLRVRNNGGARGAVINSRLKVEYI